MEKMIYNEDGSLDGEVVEMKDGFGKSVWRFQAYRTRILWFKEKDWFRKYVYINGRTIYDSYVICEHNTREEILEEIQKIVDEHKQEDNARNKQKIQKKRTFVSSTKMTIKPYEGKK